MHCTEARRQAKLSAQLKSASSSIRLYLGGASFLHQVHFPQYPFPVMVMTARTNGCAWTARHFTDMNAEKVYLLFALCCSLGKVLLVPGTPKGVVHPSFTFLCQLLVSHGDNNRLSWPNRCGTSRVLFWPFLSRSDLHSAAEDRHDFTSATAL